MFGKKGKTEDSEYGRRSMSYDQQDDDNTKRTPEEQLNHESNKLKGLEDLLDRASNVDPNICMFLLT